MIRVSDSIRLQQEIIVPIGGNFDSLDPVATAAVRPALEFNLAIVNDCLLVKREYDRASAHANQPELRSIIINQQHARHRHVPDGEAIGILDVVLPELPSKREAHVADTEIRGRDKLVPVENSTGTPVSERDPCSVRPVH